jgi:hypothetical protein
VEFVADPNHAVEALGDVVDLADYAIWAKAIGGRPCTLSRCSRTADCTSC